MHKCSEPGASRLTSCRRVAQTEPSSAAPKHLHGLNFPCWTWEREGILSLNMCAKALGRFPWVWWTKSKQRTRKLHMSSSFTDRLPWTLLESWSKSARFWMLAIQPTLEADQDLHRAWYAQCQPSLGWPAAPNPPGTWQAVESPVRITSKIRLFAGQNPRTVNRPNKTSPNLECTMKTFQN